MASVHAGEVSPKSRQFQRPLSEEGPSHGCNCLRVAPLRLRAKAVEEFLNSLALTVGVGYWFTGETRYFAKSSSPSFFFLILRSNL